VTATAHPLPAARTARGGRTLPRLLVVLAVGQPVSSLLFGLLSPEPLSSGAEYSPLVPPGPWFSIWSLVIVASIAWALLAVRPSVIDDPLRRRFAAPLAVVFVGFALWLTVASTGQSNPLTLPTFLVLIVPLLIATRLAVRERAAIASWPRPDRWVLLLLLGLYLGWTSMAFFVNVATVAQAAGAPADGVGWQLGVIALAAGAAAGIAVLSRGSRVYLVTVAYALAGIAISTSGAGLPALAVAALIGIGTTAAATIGARAIR